MTNPVGRKPNHLADPTSPCLLQHQFNPVDDRNERIDANVKDVLHVNRADVRGAQRAAGEP